MDDEPRGDAETHLIRLAGEHNLDDLQRLANHVMEVIDPDGADELLGKKLREEEEKAWNATKLSMKKRGDGTDVLRAAIEGIIEVIRSTTSYPAAGSFADTHTCRMNRATRPKRISEAPIATM